MCDTLSSKTENRIYGRYLFKTIVLVNDSSTIGITKVVSMLLVASHWHFFLSLRCVEMRNKKESKSNLLHSTKRVLNYSCRKCESCNVECAFRCQKAVRIPSLK